MARPETPERATAPLLDLDTLVARPFIRIDGTSYDILSADELSVIDSHRFANWGRRIEKLAADTSAAAETELEELVNTVSRKICVGVPDAVFAKLPGSQRMDVIDVFTALLLQNKLKVAGAMAAAAGDLPAFLKKLMPGPTGAISFPGSSDFTADNRRTGLKRFLPFWSAPLSK